MEGTLYWKIRNSREAFLVGMADGDRLISYFDLLYLLLLDACLFFMVYRMNEETIFSNQLETGLKAILYFVMFYPFVGMIEIIIPPNLFKSSQVINLSQYEILAFVNFKLFFIYFFVCFLL